MPKTKHKNKISSLKRPSKFSSSQLSLFVLVFAVIGGYLLYRSFAAAPLIYSLQGEQMSLSSPWATVVSDTTASGGKALIMRQTGTATGSFTLPSAMASLTVMARGSNCSGWPTMTVSIDGNTVIGSTTVGSTSWGSYSATKSLNSGTHSLSVKFNNDYYISSSCDRNLYIDVNNFYGPVVVATPPTVALSASPTSVTAGSSSSLTWNSTNATSCSASGAWSGNQPTSGSASTGAVNAASTYTLTCTGSGGSASATATVGINTAFTTSLNSGMTITPAYTWTFNPGVPTVKGYFWADGVLLGTAAPDAKGGYTFTIQTSSLTAGAHTLGHAWDTPEGLHKSPPNSYSVTIASTSTPPPPPAPTGTIYFNGRATNVTSMSSTGLLSTNNIVTSQSPKIWDCLCFTNNDIQLASDSRYTKVYSIKAEQGSQNPFNTGAAINEAAAAEVSHIQPMTMGRWDWYANSYKLKSGWTQTPWMTLFQFGYPTLSSPPMAFESDDLGNGIPSFQIFTNSGLLTKNSGGFYAGSLRTNWTIMNIPFDTWVEIIVGIKWETSNTGEVQVYTRIPSQTSAWSHPLSKTGIPTEQYGCTSYGCVSADFHESPTVTDHGGEYYGYYGTHSIPTNYSWQSGMVDASDLTTAQSTFPQ